MPAKKRKIEELENDEDDDDDNDDHSLLTRRQAKRRDKYVICDSSSENEIEREDLDLLFNVTSTPQKIKKNTNHIKDGLTNQPMDISNISGSISDMDVNSEIDVSSWHSISSPSISDISGMKEVTNRNVDLGINKMISDISAMASTKMYNGKDNIEINQQKENGLPLLPFLRKCGPTRL